MSETQRRSDQQPSIARTRRSQYQRAPYERTEYRAFYAEFRTIAGTVSTIADPDDTTAWIQSDTSVAVEA